RADEAGRVAAGAADGGEPRPQALVEAVTARGRRQQALRADVRRRVAGGLVAGGRAPRADALDDLLGALPRGLLGVGEDRAQRQAEAQAAAAVLRGRGAHAPHHARHLVERLAPERVHVGVAPGDLDRLVRGAAEEDGQVNRLDGAVTLAHVVEAPGVIERLL